MEQGFMLMRCGHCHIEALRSVFVGPRARTAGGTGAHEGSAV